MPKWKHLPKRDIPKRSRDSFIKIREKTNPLHSFREKWMRDEKIYFNNLYEAERVLDKVLRYKSLTQTGLRRLKKIKIALFEYESSVLKDAEADVIEKRAAERAKELVIKIENFEKKLR